MPNETAPAPRELGDADFGLITSAIQHGRDAVAAFQAGKKFTAVQDCGFALADVGQFGAEMTGESGGGYGEQSRAGAAGETGQVQGTISKIYAETRGDTAAATSRLLDEAEGRLHKCREARSQAEGVGGILDDRPILAALIKAALVALLQALAV